MKNVKKATVILSYCETAEKKEMLRSIIARLKSLYPNRSVLVYSHYGELESEYYAQADYYIFDRSNPVLHNRPISAWIQIHGLGKTFYRTGLDCGLAVVQMIKRSSLFLLATDVEKCLFLNYDTDLDIVDRIPMLEIEDSLDDKYLSMVSKWGSSEDEFSMCCFWMNIKGVGKEFFEGITHEKYLSYGPSAIGERVFCSLLRESIADRLLILKETLTTKVSMASRELPASAGDLKKYIGTIIGSVCGATGEKFLAAWNCAVNVFCISIEADGIRLDLQNECSNLSCFMAKLPANTKEIKFLEVNSICLETQYDMSLSDDYWSKNIHH